MRRWRGMWAIVMLVQLGLTVASHLAHRGGETTAAKGPLLALQGAAINGLQLEDGEFRQVRVVKLPNGQQRIRFGYTPHHQDFVRLHQV